VRSARIAAKYFTLGLAVGLLMAPRPGHETRRWLSERLTRLIQALLGVRDEAVDVASPPVATI
jgi:gas vesicle protein